MINKKSTKILVTGMLRSGTTLLQKAMNVHPEISLLYQPFPELFIGTKKYFFEQRNIPPRYHALGHYCPESDYTHQEFMEWLDGNLLPKTAVQQGFERAGELETLAGAQKGEYSFAQWYTWLLRGLCPHGEHQCLGSKEVLVEEYVPYLLKHKVRCIIIVRDPRDVITSLDYGSGKAFVGDHRPTLFNLRNWRKSVNFAQNMKDNPNFLLLKFEDLVTNPVAVLGSTAQLLDISPFHEGMWSNGLLDENGARWRGNSSFGDMQPFDKSTIGDYKNILPKETRLYVESVCRREMIDMGYNVDNVTKDTCENSIISFRENFSIKRDEFQKDYSFNNDNISYELSRLNGSFIFNNLKK